MNQGSLRKVIPMAVLMTSLLCGLPAVHGSDSNGVEQKHMFVPKNGFVPDEQTAIAIAEAVLAPIYGKQVIEKQKPFNASLSADVWTVTGSLAREELGGVFLIQISRRTAKVIRVSHSK